MEEKQILFNDIARRAAAEYDMKGYALMFIAKEKRSPISGRLFGCNELRGGSQ